MRRSCQRDDGRESFPLMAMSGRPLIRVMPVTFVRVEKSAEAQQRFDRWEDHEHG